MEKIKKEIAELLMDLWFITIFFIKATLLDIVLTYYKHGQVTKELLDINSIFAIICILVIDVCMLQAKDKLKK